MAKKMISACLVLLSISLLNTLQLDGMEHTRTGRHGHHDRRGSLNDGAAAHSREGSRSPRLLLGADSVSAGPASPAGDVYVQLGGHVGNKYTRLTIDTEPGRAGGWRGYLPTRSTFLYGFTLVATGVAIGMTLGTCSSMQTACSGARSDLEPLVSDVQRIVADFDAVKGVVCQLYPTLCPPGLK